METLQKLNKFEAVGLMVIVIINQINILRNGKD